MTVPFGQQNEQFKSSLFLVLGNRIMTCIVAVACLLVRVATSDAFSRSPPELRT